MTQEINEPVSVSLVYDSKQGHCGPRSIIWKNRIYRVNKIGLRHSYRKGEKLLYIFSVICGAVFFKLEFDTDNLHWRLLELS